MRGKCIVKELDADEARLKTSEYAVLAGLVIAATVVVLASLGAWIFSMVQMIQGAVSA